MAYMKYETMVRTAHLLYLGQDRAHIGPLSWFPDAVATARLEEQVAGNRSPARERPLAVELLVLEPVQATRAQVSARHGSTRTKQLCVRESI